MAWSSALELALVEYKVDELNRAFALAAQRGHSSLSLWIFSHGGWNPAEHKYMIQTHDGFIDPKRIAPKGLPADIFRSGCRGYRFCA